MRARLLLLILLAAAAAGMAWLAVYQVDDAYIVYRYARHVAQGDGFVFNPGERVEGVSCFLWTLALVPPAASGLPLPRVAPGVTALFGLLTLVIVVRRHALLEGHGSRTARDLLPAFLLASMPSFLYWSVGALETVPFAALIALALCDHAVENDDTSRFPRSAVWLGLAAMMRPEAPAVIAALGCDRILRGRASSRAAVRWVGILAAIVVPFLTWRRVYFGDWLPNTYYAKTGAPLAERAAAGWSYLQETAAMLVPSFGLAPRLAGIVGLVMLVGLVLAALRNERLRAEGLVVAAIAAAIVFEGGDWMVFARFLVPALPPLAVIAGAALASYAAKDRSRTMVATGVVLAMAASGAVIATRARNGGQGLAVQDAGYRHAHARIADELANRARPGDAVALMDVGMVGWLAPELRVIDITGLTDRAVAHAPGAFLDKRYPVSELLARRPRFLVLIPGFPADERIHDDPAFRAGYRQLFMVDHRFNWDPPSHYEMNVFERITP